MKELTFREVIANIKDGEIWENASTIKNLKEINRKGRLINFVFTDTDRKSFAICNDDTFILQRKKYSFTEAFKAYEEGKEIECCYGGQILKKENEKDYCFDYEKGKYVPLSFDETFFDITNIRSEWYIND